MIAAGRPRAWTLAALAFVVALAALAPVLSFAVSPVYTRLQCVRRVASEPRFARAAEQLDLVKRFAEGFRDDPAFAAPASVSEHLRAACPDLLG
ncbi:MAG TPA: hypothetical protein VFV62_03080 [Gaiellaceae bacterium]|nr:hypothetical protein [Gaiellaceae bacterium]